MLAQKDVIDRFTHLGAVPFATSPGQFAKIAHDDIVKWAKVVKESGATVDASEPALDPTGLASPSAPDVRLRAGRCASACV